MGRQIDLATLGKELNLWSRMVSCIPFAFLSIVHSIYACILFIPCGTFFFPDRTLILPGKKKKKTHWFCELKMITDVLMGFI